MFTDPRIWNQQKGFVNVVHKKTNESEWAARVNKKVKCIHLRIVVTNTVGLPDSFYAGPNGSLWIEYKRTGHPRKTIDLSSIAKPAQQRWLTMFDACGHKTWVVVRNNDAFYVFDKLEGFPEKVIAFADLPAYDVVGLAQKIDDTVGVFENCPWIARKRSPNHTKKDTVIGHII
jgi:hypothetical protein